MSGELVTQVEGQVLCGNVAGDCVCVTPPGHDTPHVCECGGSWEWNEDGTLNAIRLPGVFGEVFGADFMGAMDALGFIND